MREAAVRFPQQQIVPLLIQFNSLCSQAVEWLFFFWRLRRVCGWPAMYI